MTDNPQPTNNTQPPESTQPIENKQSAGNVQPTENAQPVKKKKSRFFVSLVAFVIKLAIIGLIGIILFGYVFGLSRNLSLNMQPAVQDGDLLLYYRIVQDYHAGDVVVLKHEGRELTVRIIAVAGDTVDITEQGLLVNGSAAQEPHIPGETTQFEGGVTFPLTVGRGQVFVLGDNRPHATDSRILGCIKEDDISGRVIGLFRRRNF